MNIFESIIDNYLNLSKPVALTVMAVSIVLFLLSFSRDPSLELRVRATIILMGGIILGFVLLFIVLNVTTKIQTHQDSKK